MATITTKKPSELPKNSSAEETTGKPSNPPGVYEHKAASAVHGRPIRLIVMPDPMTNAQADALVRMGYEWVAPAPTRAELVAMQEAQLKADQEAEAAGADPTAIQHVAADQSEQPIFNGSSDRMSAADKDAALSAALARAEAAEKALAEAAQLPETEPDEALKEALARAEAAEKALAEAAQLPETEPDEALKEAPARAEAAEAALAEAQKSSTETNEEGK